jgi:tetratricopeptide (TPR) repeat protein
VDYQGDHKKAQTYYQRVLEMNAELPAPYYNIACGFARQGKIEESLQYLDIAIRLDPAFHSEVFDDVDFDRIRNTDSFIKFMNDRAP